MVLNAQPQVRSAKITDIPILIKWTLACALESESTALDSSVVEQSVHQALQDPRLGRYFLLTYPATDDQPEVLIGQAFMTTEWGEWRNQRFWWYNSVYIDPAHRGHQYLSVLMAGIEAEAKTAGVIGVRLFVHPQNTKAIGLYKALGFTQHPYEAYIKSI